MTGTVRKLPENGRKNFGFLRDSKGVEYFFHKDDFDGHWEDLVTDVINGIEVKLKFKIVESTRGPRANSVSRLNSQTDFMENNND